MKMYFALVVLLSSITSFSQNNIQLLDNIDIGIAYDEAYSILTYDYDNDNDDDIIVAFPKAETGPFGDPTYNCEIAWYENIGNGFAAKQTIRYGGVHFPLSMEFVDIDNDNDTDIVSPYWRNTIVPDRGFQYHQQNSVNNFDTIVSLPYGSAQIPSNLVIVTSDFDYDGDIDYFTHYNSDGLGNGTSTVQLFKNNGSGTFSPNTIFSSNNLQSIKYFTIEDIDGDNIKDYVSYNHQNNKVIFYKNDGAGNVGQEIETNISVAETSELICTDINQDGFNDIVRTIGGQINWYEHLGNNQFSAAKLISDKITIAFTNTDVDFDGDIDIVAFHTNNEIVWYKNDGNGNFTNYLIANTGDLYPQYTFRGIKNIIQVSDFNGDGLKDVVMNRKDLDENLNYYLNTNSPTTEIKGVVYHDANNNQTKDINEEGLKNVRILIQPDNIYAYTNNYGEYSFIGSTETNYTIQLLVPENWTLNNQPIEYSIQLPIDPSDSYNFGLFPEINNETSFLNVSSGSTECEQKSRFTISYLNETISTQNVIIEFLSPNTTFVSDYSVNPSLISPNFLQFHLNNIHPLQSKQIDLTVELPIEFDGDTLIFDCKAIRLNDNNYPLDTIEFSYKPVLSCSSINQDKIVNPVGSGPNHEVSFETNFTYTIRFQNHNLDTIKNISIQDNIDVALNLETLKILSSSHPANIYLQNDSRVLRFDFNDVNLLPSSVNELESQGFVTFYIEPLNNLDGTIVVENSASVQFEDEPIQSTNTVFNTLVNNPITYLPEYLNYENEVKIFPNPIVKSAQVLFSNFLQENASELQIIDSKGALIQTYNIQNKSSLTIHRNNLANGNYFLTIYDDHQNLLCKPFLISFVK